MTQSLLWAAGGTGFTFLMTSLGAAVVFFFRRQVTASAQRIFLGFAAGVMIAASVWSLLIPAIEEAEGAGQVGWVPAAGGFVLGVAFLMALDGILPHLHPGAREPEGARSKLHRTTLLIFAVTLHNIPEGMAVGLSFALAAQHNDPALYAGAMALAVGMGIQNSPEGGHRATAAEGVAGRAFRWAACPLVEPVFASSPSFPAGSIQPLSACCSQARGHAHVV